MFQIDTIGMEFESTARLPDEFYKNEDVKNYFRNTHDASIESPVILLGRTAYLIDKDIPEFLRRSERATAGIEMVSTPLTFDNMEKAVPILLRNLFRYGSPDEEDRAGIHIHCAFPINVRILKNTVKLSLALESLIFHLGGMGYSFRGLKNHSIFCRPFSSFGPPVVQNKEGNYIQLLDTDVILESNDLANFWKNFGGIDMNNPPSRYHPTRYFFINPFSSLLHSTLEFRIFNTTLNPDYVLACMRFCQEFTSLTFQKDIPFSFTSSVYKPSASSEELLDRFCSVVNIDEEHKKTLFEIISKTPIPELKPTLVYTHLRDYQSIDNIWKAKLINTSEVEKSGFIDIHNFNNEERETRQQRTARTIRELSEQRDNRNNFIPVDEQGNLIFVPPETVEPPVRIVREAPAEVFRNFEAPWSNTPFTNTETYTTSTNETSGPSGNPRNIIIPGNLENSGNSGNPF